MFFDNIIIFSLDYQSKYVRDVGMGNVRCNLTISVRRFLFFSLSLSRSCIFLVDSAIVTSRVFIITDFSSDKAP